ncbi:MAG: hypothetical protein ACKO3G_10685 [Planctomycetaceae bacterium]
MHRASDPHGTGEACTPAPAAAPPGARRVWLRGNRRAAAAALGGGAVVALVLVLVVRAVAGAWPWRVGVGVAAVPLAAGAALAAAAARPRLVPRCDRLVVRVGLLSGEEVPLGIVECFFLGSRLEPPPVDDGTRGGERVRTLVMRLAERATTFASRPGFTPIGSWAEGSVTFDGRWCEPLSVDLVRRLNRELTAAKRREAAR